MNRSGRRDLGAVWKPVCSLAGHRGGMQNVTKADAVPKIGSTVRRCYLKNVRVIDWGSVSAKRTCNPVGRARGSRFRSPQHRLCFIHVVMERTGGISRHNTRLTYDATKYRGTRIGTLCEVLIYSTDTPCQPPLVLCTYMYGRTCGTSAPWFDSRTFMEPYCAQSWHRPFSIFGVHVRLYAGYGLLPHVPRRTTRIPKPGRY